MYADKKSKKKKKKNTKSFDIEPLLVSLPSEKDLAESSQPKKKKPARVSMKAKQRLKEKYMIFNKS